MRLQASYVYSYVFFYFSDFLKEKELTMAHISIIYLATLATEPVILIDRCNIDPQWELYE